MKYLPSDLLRIGATVESKYGRGKVVGLTLVSQPWDKGEGADATMVPCAAWSLVGTGYVVVDLDNGHWCYGDQVSPMEAK